MKIFLNLSTLGSKKTGLGVYSAACASIIEREFETQTLHCTALRPLKPNSIESSSGIALGNGLSGAIKRFFELRKVKVSRDYLAFSPTHHGLAKASYGIVTIHDLIALRNPRQHIAQWIFFRFFLQSIARKATAVFTVSQTSRDDIAKAYRLDKSKIYVVPNYIDLTEFSSEPVARERFFLCVGGKFFHKNIHELIENHDLWPDGFRLKIVSSSGKYREFLQQIIRAKHLENRVELMGFVSHEELVRLYRTCGCFVYPSTWEGFGIPPLEALACGARIILSDIPVHREVCGDAVDYVTLGSRESWRTALAGVPADGGKTTQESERADSRLEVFSHTAFREKLVNALDQVAERCGGTLSRKIVVEHLTHGTR